MGGRRDGGGGDGAGGGSEGSDDRARGGVGGIKEGDRDGNAGREGQGGRTGAGQQLSQSPQLEGQAHLLAHEWECVEHQSLHAPGVEGGEVGGLGAMETAKPRLALRKTK